MKHYFWTLLLLLLPAPTAAQAIDSLLLSIEANNKGLQALRQDYAAARQDAKAENRLEGPSVEYSPFFHRGVKGLASSELVVSQGFDFPTLYAARSKQARLEQAADGWQYESARRDVLLQAKLHCLDLVRLSREKALLAERRRDADQLLALYEERLAKGDATLIEINKIKMDHMAIRTAETANAQARDAALQALRALNGGQPVTFDARQYPPAPVAADPDTLLARLLRSDAALRAAEATVSARRQDVKVSRQSWMPRLELGYRRNTDRTDPSHGLLVGATIPLFAQRHRVKAARQRLAGAKLQQEEVRLQAQRDLRTQLAALRQTEEALAAYDDSLMHATLQALRKAVAGGQLPLTDYYTEADAVYRNLQERLRLEGEYQKALALLLQNEL